MKLRPYQNGQLQYFLRHIGAPWNDLEFLLSSPTGSGKTLVTQCVVSNLMRGRIKRCLVITPQRQIEAGFIPSGDFTLGTYMGDLTIRRDEWETKRESTQDVAAFLAATNTAVKVMVTTHNGVVRWNNNGPFLPDDLSGILLVVDEAHRAGDENSLGKDFIAAWKARGGYILYLTATPFRTDGGSVIPDDVRRQVRTIAEHADGIHAPSDLQVRAEAIALQATTVNQYKGHTQARGSQEVSCDDIIALMKADNWPKSVVVVPATGSVKWASLLEKKLKAEGRRVRNVVGTADDAATWNGEQDDLTLLLNRERAVVDYRDSEVDVILACKRFDEGTDWPLCSHLYNIGVPGAFNLILQRWGRTMRLKRGIANYPQEHLDTACITFLVPHLSEAVWDKFAARHKDHVFLLGCFLHDMKTAQAYRAALRWRPEDVGRSRSGKPNPAHQALVEDLQAEMMGLMGESSSASAISTTVQIELALRDQGIEPTLSKLIEYGERTLKLPPEQMQEVKDFWGIRMLLTSDGQTHQDKLIKKLKVRTRKPGASLPVGLIRQELRGAFDEVIALYEDTVIDQSGGSLLCIGQLTNRTAAAISQDLHDRLKGRTYGLDVIKATILAFHAKEGGPPTATSGSASTYGLPIRWNALNESLRRLHGTTLSQLCIEMGLRRPSKFSFDEAKAGILAFHAKEGSPPNGGSGDASEYFGVSINWSTVRSRLYRNHGTSLLQLCIKLGIQAPTSFGLDKVKAAILACYAKEGKLPTNDSGDASAYFGGTIQWGTVDRRCQTRHGITLSQLCIEMGLRTPPCKPDLDEAKDAILACYAKEGKLPTNDSGDASAYFGRSISWCVVQSHLKARHGTTISQLGIEMGLRAPPRKFELDEFKDAILACYAKEGRLPTNGGRDASAYFGRSISWHAIQQRLITNHGTTIAQLKVLMQDEGLLPNEAEVRASLRKLDLDKIKDAILVCYAKEERLPITTRGEASAYFGRSISWAGIDQRLRTNHGTTLTQLKVLMRAEGRLP